MELTVVNVPKLRPEAYIETKDEVRMLAEKYRSLRLKSLKTAPEAFASRYEDEVQKDLAHTLERLKNPEADHFFALDKSIPANPAQPVEQYLREIVAADFIGMIVLVGPIKVVQINVQRTPLDAAKGMRQDDTEEIDNGISAGNPEVLHYQLSGTYVDTEHRRKGVGEALIKAAVDKIRAKAEQHGCEFTCSVPVDSENLAARSFYWKAGFVHVGQEMHVQQPRALLGESVASERVVYWYGLRASQV